MLFLPINVVATIVVVAADAHIFEVFASKPSHWGKGCCSVGVDHIFEVFASKPSRLGKGCYCCWPYLPNLWSKAKPLRQRLLLLKSLKSFLQSQAVVVVVVVVVFVLGEKIDEKEFPIFLLMILLKLLPNLFHECFEFPLCYFIARCWTIVVLLSMKRSTN